MNDDTPVLVDLMPADAPADTPAAPEDGDAADVPVLKSEAADDKKLPERAIQHADGSIELPLFVPVALQWRAQAGGEVRTDPPVSTVTFRRLNGKQVRQIMSSGEGEKFMAELTAAAVCTQFPNKHKWWLILDRMDGADTAACMRIAQHFLESGPKTPGR